MWSDKESKIDFLNFNETAESIKDLITEKMNYSRPNTRSNFERSGSYRSNNTPESRSSNSYTPSAPARSGSTSNSSGSRRR